MRVLLNLVALLAAISYAQTEKKEQIIGNPLPKELMKEVTGSWGEWLPWANPCSKTCGNEGWKLQSRSRLCEGPGYCHEYGFSLQTGLEDLAGTLVPMILHMKVGRNDR